MKNPKVIEITNGNHKIWFTKKAYKQWVKFIKKMEKLEEKLIYGNN
jgi:hypothetical protein